jgi:hypothetical protein
MNPSPPIIEIHGDDVTVEASYLAARLGLPVDRLRAEMRRGIIYSVVERGVGEDAGRLRLAFRYRARAWTVVVQPDGTLSEAPWSGGKPGSHQPPAEAVLAARGKPAGRPAPHTQQTREDAVGSSKVSVLFTAQQYDAVIGTIRQCV